ncbi:MAG: hypothetical protein IGS23_14980 [Rivularia sp. T60_A2020_040]|nr:hypothetical protein [Rivularia sp. T60_A2020_040]
MKASGNKQPGAITAPEVLAIAIILGIQKLLEQIDYQTYASPSGRWIFSSDKESSTQFISKLISNS